MPNFPIIELDFIDSTNNYAMHLIDANKAQHGLTIVAERQTNGKGQRGKTWLDSPGKSLSMTIIVNPRLEIMRQFEFNASVAVAIANVLQKLFNKWKLAIKWPNDIIINDKKAAGILIENILRGQSWAYSVIGVGINLTQEFFPEELPFATSLKIESGLEFDRNKLIADLHESILSAIDPGSLEKNFRIYNEFLYKLAQKQQFSDDSGKWNAKIISVGQDGRLEVEMERGEVVKYYHGQVTWEWQ